MHRTLPILFTWFSVDLVSFNLLLTAALAFIYRHQSALLDIKLFFLDDNPLVETTATQGLSLVFFERTFSFKWQDVSHNDTEGVVGFPKAYQLKTSSSSGA